jgi:spermidine dehydrogenase
MSETVERRDIHDGKLAQQPGLRGLSLSAASTMHQMAFRGKQVEIDDLSASETFDFVVAGAGVSGLAAAYYYRQRFGADAKILIVDPLDDFGGHAARNEFTVGGKKLIGYGGSESFQSPATTFTPEVRALFAELGIDLAKFSRQYFAHSLYSKLGLSRASFFSAETFGRDTLVRGDPSAWVSDDVLPENLNARPIEAFLADFPLPEGSRQHLIDVFKSDRVRLERFSTVEGRLAYLAQTSYADFLRVDWRLPADAAAYFAHRTLDFFGLPASKISALDARHYGYPGFQGIDLPSDHTKGEGPLDEPYVYHFPDGNASLARLLVRALIPGIAPGQTMEDIVLADFDYSKLDSPANNVRIRLGCTAAHVKNSSDGYVDIGIVQGDSVQRIRSRHATMACFNMAIAYVLRDLPAEQAAALKENVKAPLVYTTVAVRNWLPWVKLGVHDIYGVDTFHVRAKLDFPVSMGGYSCTTDPNEPILLHLVHVPCVEDPQIDPRSALRKARSSLMKKDFAFFETAVRSDLTRMLGPGGFDADRDIAAITVNRWSHGYAYSLNNLVESTEEGEKTMALARRRVGQVTIAGSDAGWNAYAHTAIDEARRAVAELP